MDFISVWSSTSCTFPKVIKITDGQVQRKTQLTGSNNHPLLTLGQVEIIGMRLRISIIAILILNRRNLCLVVRILAIAVPNRHQDVVAPMVVSMKIGNNTLISIGRDAASLVYADKVLTITDTPFGFTA